MGYSVFETPNDLILERNLACYERDQARFDRDAANAAFIQARADADYLSRENQQLKMQLAKLSAEKWENPRSFATCPDGSVYSIEPSNHHKFVGIMAINGAELIAAVVDGVEKVYIKVDYFCGAENNQTAVIPVDKISKVQLLPYFNGFKRECSKALANEFLYCSLIQLINSKDLNNSVYPEFPGLYFQTDDNGKVIDADYLCLDNEIDDSVNELLSPSFQKKVLGFTDKSFTQVLNDIKPYLNENATYVLLAYSLAGTLASFLALCSHDLPAVLTVATKDEDGEKLASCFLKSFDRCKQPKSLSISKTELTKILRAAKDEVVVLRDDTTAESNVKRTSSLDTILGIRSDEAYKAHLIAILSNTIHYFMPPERVLPLEMGESFGKGISTKERCVLGDNLSAMHRILIDEFCYAFPGHSTKLNAMITALKREDYGFDNESAKSTFAVLYGVLLFWAEVFHTKLPYGFKEYLIKLIADSQSMETGKDLATINTFFHLLDDRILSGILKVTESGRDMAFCEGQNMLIHDGEFLLMEESTMKNVFLPRISTAATVSGILSALKQESYLVSTNGNRKPTTVYDKNKTPKQMKLIAFRFENMVSSDTLQTIESLKIRQYFGSAIPDKAFIPLIQDFRGKTAGQLLCRGMNQHRFVTGKSGSGKTIFLILLLYWLSQAGNRVVVFDSSSSFTKETLKKALPAAFVEEHVTFYNMKQEGVPVNLFHTYASDKPRSRKEMLCSILGEAIHEPSLNQEQALAEFIRGMLLKNENPTYLDFLTCLEDAEGTSELSIVHKFKSVFSDMMDNNEDPKDDWFTFLGKCKDIVIISMDEVTGENGSQMMDMMLASLYHAQLHEDEPAQLSIVLDEIQNQNLSDGSVICKILKEGRKHCIDLNYATQYVAEAKKNRMLKQAALSVYFQPDQASRASVASMLGLKKRDEYRLDRLCVGECFMQGSIYNFDTGCNEEAVVIG